MRPGGRDPEAPAPAFAAPIHRPGPLRTSQRLPASLRLLVPGWAQVRVVPAAETVLQVPCALTMSDQHQLVGGHGCGSGCGADWGSPRFRSRRPALGCACALAPHPPAPSHLHGQIFPLAPGHPPPAGCTHALRAGAAAAGWRGRSPRKTGRMLPPPSTPRPPRRSRSARKRPKAVELLGGAQKCMPAGVSSN